MKLGLYLATWLVHCFCQDRSSEPWWLSLVVLDQSIRIAPHTSTSCQISPPPFSRISQTVQDLSKGASLALRQLAPCRSTLTDSSCALSVHVNRHGACLAQALGVRRQQAALVLLAARWNNEAVHKVLSMLPAIDEQLFHTGDVLLPLLAWQAELDVVLRCRRIGPLVGRDELAAVLENVLASFKQWMLKTGKGSLWLRLGFGAGLVVLAGFLDQPAVLVSRGSPA